MMSTETAAIRPKVKRGSGPQIDQATKASDGDGDDGGHEPAGDLIGQPLDRRAAALRLGDHLHDPREQRVAADLLGAHDERAGLVERAADDAGRRLPWSPASTRRSPSTRRRRLRPSTTSPSTGTFSPGRTRSRSPTPTWSSGTSSSRAVGLDPARGLRREVEQRADGAAGLLAGAQLQHLAEQHQHGDDGGGLEVDRDRAVHAAERCREEAGRERRDDAVEPRRRRCRCAISVNMLRLRVTSEAQPRSKNGQPAHSTTGVASASCEPVRQSAGRAACGGR